MGIRPTVCPESSASGQGPRSGPFGFQTSKTGTGRADGTTNKCNHIPITFPPDKGAIIVAAYFDSGEYTPQVEARHEAVLAKVGALAAQWAIG